MLTEQAFKVGDYIVFSLTVLLSVAIGIYFACSGKKNSTTLNYFHGDRQLSYGPVALSLVVTFQSSIMLLGFPAEVYYYGYMICLFNIGQCAAIYIATRIVVPLMYPLKITSVYHYLTLRYTSQSVRLLTVAIGIISQCIYMGVVLFGPAIALQSVTSFPAWASILCIALASVIYTSIGGILAVIWTDVLQCVIMILGIIAILIKGTIDAGGSSYVMTTNAKSGRLDLFDFNPDPTVRHTFWTIMIGSFVGSFSLSLSQSTIQRFNSTPSIKDANKVMYIAGPVFIAMQMMSMSVGLVCFAYFMSKQCDPLLSGQITNANQIVPFMIVDIFKQYQGLSGLFISSLFSASLSTISSNLAGLSAITVEDLIKPYFNLTDKTLTKIAKLSVLVFGGLGICVAFLISRVEGSLTQILFSIMGAATGPSVGIFFLSMFYYKSTSKGMIIGGVVGLIISFWICIGSNVTPTLPKPPVKPLPSVDRCFLNTGILKNNTELFVRNNTDNLPQTTITYLSNFTQASMTSSTAFTGNGSTQASQGRQGHTVTGVEKLYTVSYALFSTIGTGVTVLVGFVASLLTFDPEVDKPDTKYILSLRKQIFCCCNRQWFKSNCSCKKDSDTMKLEKANRSDKTEPDDILLTNC